ncbi:plasmid fertility inhibition factor family protein [Providencia stuartii]|uniref:plasmid fertility inhibition factor family protein n=1 Tax=Providencia stuartii TaxID=588 RepID=UPI003D9A6B09
MLRQHGQALLHQDPPPKDRKYPSSAAHFAVGIDSPVPLADVSPTMILGHFAVCFTDGMTRSMWLLAHEVAVFPVLSRDEASAVMLAEHVGVAAPIQVSKLREQCRKI